VAPPRVGDAFKITLSPEQIGPEGFAVMETVGAEGAVTVNRI
jgi:hypothetical protein